MASLYIGLAQLGEALVATKKRLEHSALIGAYWKTLAPDEIAPATRLLIGRIFAENDPRIVNLSGAALGRALEKAVGAPIEWSESAVDFGDAVAQWLESRGWQVQGEPLTLMEVYATYEEIATLTGAGSRTRKDAALVGLLKRASPVEAKYLVKQVTGEMRVGVSEGALLDALARNTGIAATTVRRANQVAGDVGAVAAVALTEGELGLARLGLQLGRALKPMLAQSAETVTDALEQMPPPVAFEDKLDGARVQIHKRGETVQLFSRHLSDITASLPEIADLARTQIRADEAILEGEVIAIDERGRARPFQILMRRVGRERKVEEMQVEIPVKLFLFDCLYRDGTVMLEEPYDARRAALEEIAGEIPLVRRARIETEAEGQEFLRAARGGRGTKA